MSSSSIEQISISSVSFFITSSSIVIFDELLKIAFDSSPISITNERCKKFHHGQETLEAKSERSARLAELREIETFMFEMGMATGARWRGRKPTGR